VEEASHDAASTPPTQVVGEAGQAATDVPSADMAGEVRDVGMSMGAVGSHAIRTVDFSQPTLPLGQALELPARHRGRTRPGRRIPDRAVRQRHTLRARHPARRRRRVGRADRRTGLSPRVSAATIGGSWGSSARAVWAPRWWALGLRAPRRRVVRQTPARGSVSSFTPPAPHHGTTRIIRSRSITREERCPLQYA
jgi:hypothetical protein